MNITQRFGIVCKFPGAETKRKLGGVKNVIKGPRPAFPQLSFGHPALFFPYTVAGPIRNPLNQNNQHL
jgi:hypothetical protein